ncbi:putative HTH-type transcriptional regulator [Polaromonas vacuolata]|uniref:Putative HTH-type transcriptional regulator n=2 Tax=Polaromonas vacuolata TaxID=37448 RepID=A0A6H2HD69_9BURK|nr:putative HTH-type transcriptional regulator [Polaromonas vacuolata]
MRKKTIEEAISTMDSLHNADKAATPIAFVKAIVAAYKNRSMSPAKALALAQIAPELLRQSLAHITARQMELLSAAAMQELGDEALGAFSRRLPWGSYGMLARASISSPNLGVALKRWCRHHSLLTDDITLTLSHSNNMATITVQANAPQQEFGLVHVLRNIHGLASWLIDSRIALESAQFPFTEPAHSAVYQLIFPGRLSFDAALAELHFDARYLALPLRRDEKALQQMLKRALPLTVQQYRRDRLLVQQIRQTLSADSRTAHTAESLAALLNISSRTLHRQLQEEGASLQKIKDEVRTGKAKDLLLRGHQPVKQVAAASGFGNEKSFIRAFKQWTGQSPGEFRQALKKP